MEHQQALETMAAERYLLHEMSEEEQEAFEEHFFDCALCAADVSDGLSVREGLRATAARGAVVVPMPVRQSGRWVPQAAAAAIVSALLTWFAATSAFAPPAVKIIHIQQHYLSTEQSRAATDEKPVEVRIPDDLTFEVPTPPDAESFVYSIRDSAGSILFSQTLTLDEALKPVTVGLHALPRGSYEVVIEGVRKGGNRFPITSRRFKVVEER